MNARQAHERKMERYFEQQQVGGCIRMAGRLGALEVLLEGWLAERALV